MCFGQCNIVSVGYFVFSLMLVVFGALPSLLFQIILIKLFVCRGESEKPIINASRF
jgi:hypothetical protein